MPTLASTRAPAPARRRVDPVRYRPPSWCPAMSAAAYREGRAPCVSAHTLTPRRCQAMTVSGWTMTSAARHSVHTRESTTQSQRSAFARPQPPRSGALQHLQLMLQRQDFDLERDARTRRGSQGQKEGQQHRHDHPAAYPSAAATSTAVIRELTFQSVQARTAQQCGKCSKEREVVGIRRPLCDSSSGPTVEVGPTTTGERTD